MANVLSIVAWAFAVVLYEFIVPSSFSLISSRSWKTDLFLADKTFFFKNWGVDFIEK